MSSIFTSNTNFILFLTSVGIMLSTAYKSKIKPCIIGTWDFSAIGMNQIKNEGFSNGEMNAIDAIEHAIKAVEANNDDQYYVGKGGMPNSAGYMECDAAIMTGNYQYGAVLAIQDTVHAITVARSIMTKCVHNVLCSCGAMMWSEEHGLATKDKSVYDLIT